VPAFRNVTLKCLTEIGSLAVPEQYEQQFIVLYNMVITSIMKTIPVQTDLAEVYENANDDDQQFIQNLGLFLTAFFSQHLATIEAGGDNSLLINGHWYLLRISLVKEREVFKVCLDYWYTFVSSKST
jgi:exportin-1